MAVTRKPPKYPRELLETQRISQKPPATQGNPWQHKGNPRNPREPMEAPRNPWKPLETLGNPWKPSENPKNPLEIPETPGKWKLKEIFIPFLLQYIQGMGNKLAHN